MSVLFPKTISYLVVTGSRVKGKFVEVETPGTFTGDVQPVTGRDLDVVQVGRQDIGKIKVYANESLNVSVEGSNTPGDMIIWQGGKWEIIAKMANQNDLIPHYKYIAEYREESS